MDFKSLNKTAKAYKAIIQPPTTVESVLFAGKLPDSIKFSDIKFDLLQNSESPVYRAMSKDRCTALFIRFSMKNSKFVNVWFQSTFQYGPNINTPVIDVDVDIDTLKGMEEPARYAVEVLLVYKAKDELIEMLGEIDKFCADKTQMERLVNASKYGVKLVKKFIKS